MVFDLEYGAVASSVPLPHGVAPFDRVLTSMHLGCTPSGVLDRGMTRLWLLHRDGALTVWDRAPNTLAYRCVWGKGGNWVFKVLWVNADE